VYSAIRRIHPLFARTINRLEHTIEYRISGYVGSGPSGDSKVSTQ
jgi:hypothetical protein